jgi:hypothetical protein
MLAHERCRRAAALVVSHRGRCRHHTPRDGDTVSALPLRPFGVPDLVWPPGVCEVCCEPQWSDALRDWEFVEGVAGPCGACRVLQMTTRTVVRAAV